MSLRNLTPAKSMCEAASYAAARAVAIESPSAVTLRMRPPFVTRRPSRTAVPGGLCLGDSLDRSADIPTCRIVAAGEDDRHRRLFRYRQRDACDAPRRTGGERLEQIAVEAGEQGLRLGIAEAAVVLEHSRPVVRQHQPGEENADERDPPLGKLLQDRRAGEVDELRDLAVRKSRDR
jgi:hypothetical protein